MFSNYSVSLCDLQVTLVTQSPALRHMNRNSSVTPNYSGKIPSRYFDDYSLETEVSLSEKCQDNMYLHGLCVFEVRID